MKNQFLVPELREYITNQDYDSLGEFCAASHPVDIAEFLAPLAPKEIWGIISKIDPAIAVEIFCNLDLDIQLRITASLKREEFAGLIANLPPDDRVDLLKRVPIEKREALLPALAQAEREDIRRLASYPEGTAGAVMTSDYAALARSLTAQQAIAKLRQEAPDKETIYYAFVVDESRRLIGFVSLKDLILAHPEALIESLMHKDIVHARVTDDKEDAARSIQKYDLLALPIINEQNALVGIITHDDALDVITQEHTEDMERLMAIAGRHDEGVYIKTPVIVHFRNRAGWIVGLSVMGLVSGSIIHSYEDTMLKLMILALYMPMIADTGGNIGSQSATVVIRALALKEITPQDIVKVTFKELKISLLLSIALALVTMGKVMFLSQGLAIPAGLSLPLIGAAISVALALQVISSAFIGAILPLAVARLDLDPALVASPALTTIVDATGLLIYFSITKMILGL